MSVYGNACLVHGRIDMFFISCTSSLCLFFLLVFFAVFFSIAFCLHNFHYTTSTLIIEILNYVVPNRSVLCFFFLSLQNTAYFVDFYRINAVWRHLIFVALDELLLWYDFLSFYSTTIIYLYLYTFIVSQVQKKWKEINKFVFICLFWLFLEIVRNTFSTTFV